MLVNGISYFTVHHDFSWSIIFVTPITILLKKFRRCVEKVQVDHSWESLKTRGGIRLQQHKKDSLSLDNNITT